jgi:hypothetical protein
MVVETMKREKSDYRKNQSTEKNLTRDVGIVYIALFAVMMLFSTRIVHADFTTLNKANQLDSPFPTLISVGRGELTWLGLSIYQASLWTSDGEFHGLEQSLPIALTITYEKNIDNDALVDRTVEEWLHLGIFSEETRSFWAKQLLQIWPDVRPGDSITTLVNEDRSTQFYFNNSLLKELDDPAFGAALLSIWLDPNTSEPDLRAKLIGRQES